MVHDKFPPLRTPKIERRSAGLSQKDLDTYTHVGLLAAPGRPPRRALPLAGMIEERLRGAGYELGDDKPFTIDLPDRRGTRLALAGLAPDATAFERLSLARKLIGALMEQRGPLHFRGGAAS